MAKEGQLVECLLDVLGLIDRNRACRGSHLTHTASSTCRHSLPHSQQQHKHMWSSAFGQANNDTADIGMIVSQQAATKRH